MTACGLGVGKRLLPVVGEELQIEPHWQRFVGYIAVGGVADGTVFFVSVPTDSPFQPAIGYAVTCRHVIEKGRHNNPDDIAILVNVDVPEKPFGALAIKKYPAPYSAWTCSDTHDIAVCRFERVPGMTPWLYPLKPAWDERLRFGRDVFFVGMLWQLADRDPLDVIIRSGFVAHPKVSDEVYLDFHEGDEKKVVCDIALIESRSWGGESGSPVFVYDEQPVAMPQTTDFPPDITILSKATLAGIMSGHHRHDADVQGGKGGSVPMNSGIAIVTPIYALRDFLLENQKLVDDRAEIIKQHERATRARTKRMKPDVSS